MDQFDPKTALVHGTDVTIVRGFSVWQVVRSYHHVEESVTRGVLLPGHESGASRMRQ